VIRAFLALPLPDAAISSLIRIQAALPLTRPVAPENLHLTLVFLGEQTEPVLQGLHDDLTALRAPGFDLQLAGIDHFGAEIRQVHATLAPQPALAALQAKLAQAARRAGIGLDRRRFVPHVTLARGASDPLMLARALPRLPPMPAPFAVTGYALMRSTLTRHGSEYDILATYPLSERPRA